MTEGFSGGPVVKSLPCNEGDAGLIPGLERSHMLLGNFDFEPQVLKSMCLEPVLHSKRNHHTEKPAHRNWSVFLARGN